jgi:transposase
LVAELHEWLSEQRPRLARGNDVARAIDYLLKRWVAFTRFLDDGRICISNNAAERALGASPSSASLGYSAARTAAGNAPR